ncbi:hypothetical protein DCAR_0312441 [Daucus carota subsp. sativus]|uniref:Uncharacterized protein n=1 Tax=Daucus carota subsp. sativus TaxID=79200 RepID=A0A166B0V9_DAUCS|nr:hypothetical protein DCAR_0312441 [Daucus carota subsp. sativus]
MNGCSWESLSLNHITCHECHCASLPACSLLGASNELIELPYVELHELYSPTSIFGSSLKL